MRLLFESDRNRVIEQLVGAIRAGLQYPTPLGAVAEAWAREVRPYPHVGFNYHAFMVRTRCTGLRWLPAAQLHLALGGYTGL